MKRTILMLFVTMLITPYLVDSVVYGNPTVTKQKGGTVSTDKNIGRTDSVTFDFDKISNTISIGYGDETKATEVSIYKDGALIYKDTDKTNAETLVNYEITDAEKGDYTVVVTVNGDLKIDETVTIEEGQDE